MAASDYSTVILNALKSQMGRAPSVEALRDAIVQRMTIFDEDRGIFPAPPSNQPEQRPLLVDPSIRRVESPAAPPPQVDVTQVIAAGKPPLIDPDRTMKPEQRKLMLNTMLKMELPEKLPVTIQGRSVVLDRVLENAPGEMEFVRVRYVAPGTETQPFIVGEGVKAMIQPGNQGCVAQVDTGVTRLNTDEILSDIMAQAQSMYGAEPRQVVARGPLPRIALGDGIGTETDRSSSDAELQHWAKFAGSSAGGFERMSENDARMQLARQQVDQEAGFR